MKLTKKVWLLIFISVISWLFLWVLFCDTDIILDYLSQKLVNSNIIKFNTYNVQNQNYEMNCKIYIYNVDKKLKGLDILSRDPNETFLFNQWKQDHLPYFFYNALLNHSFRTNNSVEADLFYIPSWSAHPYPNFDKLIQPQKGYIKVINNISNHFTVLWKPSRKYNYHIQNELMLQNQSITKLSVELLGSDYKGWMVIPYLSSYTQHPRNYIEQFHVMSTKKKYFISGIFHKRGNWSMSGKLRRILTEQCSNYKNKTCFYSALIFNDDFMNIYKDSVFTLQPTGDSYTRKGVFDSLLVGAIPVIFDLRTFQIDPLFQIDMIQHPLFIYIDGIKVINGEINVVQRLLSIDPNQIQRIRYNIKHYVYRLRYYDYRYRHIVKHKSDAIDWILKHLCNNTKSNDRV